MPLLFSRLLSRSRRLLVILCLVVLTGLGLSVPAFHLWAEYHFRAAEDALASYHPAEARRHLQQALRVWPHSAATHLLAARAARQLGDLEAAATHLEECFRSQGTDAETRLELLLLRAQRGEMDSVAGRCRSLVVREDAASPLVLEALAAGYLRLYRLNEAEDCARLWAERQPDNPRAQVVRGWILEHWDARTEAADCYRRALKLDPENDEARSRLASVLLDRQRAAEAAPHLEYLVERQPDNLLLQVELARCRYQLGRPAEAAELLDRVLDRNPRLFHALVLRGQVALETGESARAADRLQRALVQHPGDYKAHFLLHQALLRLGRTDQAAKEDQQMRKALADLERFRDILRRKMSEAPRDPALHAEVGRLLLRAGYPAEGLRWLHSALALDPRQPRAHAALAEYYEALGSAGQAQRHRQLARSKSP
jgi:tetratricopeptide (TPR) repeat protein